MNNSQRAKELDREAERERERQREREIRAFREFSTKLPIKANRRSREPSLANDQLEINAKSQANATHFGGPHQLQPVPNHPHNAVLNPINDGLNMPPISGMKGVGPKVDPSIALTPLPMNLLHPSGNLNHVDQVSNLAAVSNRKTPRTLAHMPPIDSSGGPVNLSQAQPPTNVMNHSSNPMANGMRSRGGARPQPLNNPVGVMPTNPNMPNWDRGNVANMPQRTPPQIGNFQSVGASGKNLAGGPDIPTGFSPRYGNNGYALEPPPSRQKNNLGQGVGGRQSSRGSDNDQYMYPAVGSNVGGTLPQIYQNAGGTNPHFYDNNSQQFNKPMQSNGLHHQAYNENNSNYSSSMAHHHQGHHPHHAQHYSHNHTGKNGIAHPGGGSNYSNNASRR
jgi:hypothetical protein